MGSHPDLNDYLLLEHIFDTINVGTTSQNGRKESSSVKQAVCSCLLNHEDRRLPSVDSIGYRHHIMHSWFVQFDRIKSVPYKLTSVSHGQKRSRLGKARRYTACPHAHNHTKHTPPHSECACGAISTSISTAATIVQFVDSAVTAAAS